jgi:hypothetical protein
MTDKDFEAWAETILGDNPAWRESGDGELARQAWNAATSLERERAARVCETQDTYGDSVGCWFETLANKIRSGE